MPITYFRTLFITATYIDHLMSGMSIKKVPFELGLNDIVFIKINRFSFETFECTFFTLFECAIGSQITSMNFSSSILNLRLLAPFHPL
jgi:hypothetical protein